MTEKSVVEETKRALVALQRIDCSKCGAPRNPWEAECSRCDAIHCPLCGARSWANEFCTHAVRNPDLTENWMGVRTPSCLEGIDGFDLEHALEQLGTDRRNAVQGLFAGIEPLIVQDPENGEYGFDPEVLVDASRMAGVEIDGPYCIDYGYGGTWVIYFCAAGHEALEAGVGPLLDELDRALLPLRDAILKEAGDA